MTTLGVLCTQLFLEYFLQLFRGMHNKYESIFVYLCDNR